MFTVCFVGLYNTVLDLSCSFCYISSCDCCCILRCILFFIFSFLLYSNLCCSWLFALCCILCWISSYIICSISCYTVLRNGLFLVLTLLLQLKHYIIALNFVFQVELQFVLRHCRVVYDEDMFPGQSTVRVDTPRHYCNDTWPRYWRQLQIGCRGWIQ